MQLTLFVKRTSFELFGGYKSPVFITNTRTYENVRERTRTYENARERTTTQLYTASKNTWLCMD